jgi:hypothetical protein
VGASAVYQLPYPEPGDPADVPTDLHELVDAIEAKIMPGTVGGQVPVWDNTAKKWAPAGGGMTLVAEAVLAAPAASIDFTVIPAGYRSLRLAYLVRADGAATVGITLMRFNGDATASYDYQGVLSSNGAVSNSQGAAQAFMRVGTCCQNLSAAFEFAAADIDIPGYANTATYKGYSAKSAGPNTAVASSFASLYGGGWRNQAAINRITLLPDSGNFVVGSRAYLLAVT